MAEKIKKLFISDDFHKTWFHQKSAEDIQQLVKKGRVLDVGCGKGFIIGSIPEGYERYGMDIQKSELNFVKQKNNNKIELICCSALFFPFRSGVFDAVVSTEVIEHVPDDKKAVHEIYRVLNDKGIFVVTAPVKGVLSRFAPTKNEFGEGVLGPDHLREYSSVESLIQICYEASKNGFKLFQKNRRPIQFPLRILLKPIFKLLKSEDILKNNPLLVPILFYYYTGYVVFKKTA